MATVIITIKDESSGGLSMEVASDPPFQREASTNKQLDPTPAQLISDLVVQLINQMLGEPNHYEAEAVNSRVVLAEDMGDYFITAKSGTERGN